MALSDAARRNLNSSQFAIPSKAKTGKQKAEAGNYPIEDRKHAELALAYSKGKPVQAQVARAVHKKYPDLG